jgi:alpha-amylase
LTLRRAALQGSSQGHWRFPGHALEQGYAYILTHPGTPCVFYDHAFQDQTLGHAVQRLVALRRRNALHCRSAVKILAATHDVYAAEIDGKVVMKIGPGPWGPDLQRWQVADCGHAWAVWELKEGARGEEPQ